MYLDVLDVLKSKCKQKMQQVASFFDGYNMLFAGGLKTGPSFKRMADMCDKRTSWIHWYLQYFVHVQCSHPNL